MGGANTRKLTNIACNAKILQDPHDQAPFPDLQMIKQKPMIIIPSPQGKLETD
jgi:hypothetical protein